MQNSETTLGIIGDGQLGMMLAESAARRGVSFVGLGKDLRSPFAKRFPREFRTKISNKLKALTIENEFLSSEQLNELACSAQAAACPSPRDYQFFENKIAQREFFDSLQIPSPRWTKNLSEARFPCVLKSSAGGYDGYGVRVVDRSDDFDSAFQALGGQVGRELLAEEKVEIQNEFAQGVLLDGKGGVIYLPLVETIQRDGICILVLSQPRIASEELVRVSAQANAILDQVIHSNIRGLFHFEFFYTQGGKLLLNEGAPRPHNSSHLSMNACEYSQFDLLVEFLQRDQLPLPSGTRLEAIPSVMINLLGRSSGVNYQLRLPKIDERLEVYPHLYLKEECRVGRKMGHLNLVDRRKEHLDADAFYELARVIFEEYQL